MQRARVTPLMDTPTPSPSDPRPERRTAHTRSERCYASHYAGLQAIFDPAVKCVVLPRSLPVRLQRAVATSLQRGAHAAVEVDAARRGLGSEHFPGLCGDSAALRADIRSLSDLFRALFGWGPLGIRLASLARPMCPRFHVDHVEVRLVCTYTGPGTEYLLEGAVNRQALGQPPAAGIGFASGLQNANSPIEQCPTGAIFLMKGEAWPGNAGGGLVHRSPETHPHGTGRLVLSIDALFAIDHAATHFPAIMEPLAS